MGNRNVIDYVGALVVEGDSFLLVRSLSSDDIPLSGFHLPGGKYFQEDSLEKDIKILLGSKYQCEVTLISSLSPIEGEDKDGNPIRLFPCLIKELSPLRFPGKHFEYRYLSVKDLDNVYVDPIDKIAAKKLMAFLPLLYGTVRKTPLTPKEIDKVNVMLHALEYFKARMDLSSAKEFRALLDCEASYESIVIAFKAILEQYHLDINEYIDIMSYKDAKIRRETI